jgi:hypothetical protein
LRKRFAFVAGNDDDSALPSAQKKNARSAARLFVSP